MLVCESCFTECCHTYCLEEKVEGVPDEKWYCDYCVKNRGLKNLLPVAGIFKHEQVKDVRIIVDKSENKDIAKENENENEKEEIIKESCSVIKEDKDSSVIEQDRNEIMKKNDDIYAAIKHNEKEIAEEEKECVVEENKNAMEIEESNCVIKENSQIKEKNAKEEYSSDKENRISEKECVFTENKNKSPLNFIENQQKKEETEKIEKEAEEIKQETSKKEENNPKIDSIPIAINDNSSTNSQNKQPVEKTAENQLESLKEKANEILLDELVEEKDGEKVNKSFSEQRIHNNDAETKRLSPQPPSSNIN